MTIPVLSTVPDREALRALYDEAVKQINPSRPTIDLTTGFYAETGNAVFEAGYLALSDYFNGPSGPHPLPTLSASAPGSNATYSYALMRALIHGAAEYVDKSIYEIRRLVKLGLFPKPRRPNGRQWSWQLGQLADYSDSFFNKPE